MSLLAQTRLASLLAGVGAAGAAYYYTKVSFSGFSIGLSMVHQIATAC